MPSAEELRQVTTNLQAPPPAKYAASIHQSGEIPTEVGELIEGLEAVLKSEIWFLFQDNDDDEEQALASMTRKLAERFITQVEESRPKHGVTVFLQSDGGDAVSAFRIASAFQERAGAFKLAIIPTRAKSAGTLLALGASQIWLAPYAELGPLDAQVISDRTRWTPALDRVGAVNQLHRAALDAFDQTVLFMMVRAGFREPLPMMEPAAAFVTSLMKPLFDKIDVAQYTELSRILAIGEDYARRLMTRAGMPRALAVGLASVLVRQYPEHGFIIDAREAEEIGLLQVRPVPEHLEAAVTSLGKALAGQTVLGTIRKVTP